MLNVKLFKNAIVMHKAFGKGIVKNIDEKYLEIEFTTGKEVSKFLYPSCFDKFLTLEEAYLQDIVSNDLEQWKVENGFAEKEALRQRYEKTQNAIKARQLAAGEKKRSAANRAVELRHKNNPTIK